MTKFVYQNNDCVKSQHFLKRSIDLLNRVYSNNSILIFATLDTYKIDKWYLKKKEFSMVSH